MAFTGVAVVKQITDTLVRITGVSLAGEGAEGTIALFEGAAPLGADIALPASFQPRPFDNPDAAVAVTLQDGIQVSFVFTELQTVVPPIQVDKIGTTPEDFLITLTNDLAVEGSDSGDLEIWVRWH
jgi:hypothetical protein